MKKTTKPAYETYVRNGRFNLVMLEPSADGKTHSINCEWPLWLYEKQEIKVYDADGNESIKETTELVKQTKNKTIKYLLNILGF